MTITRSGEGLVQKFEEFREGLFAAWSGLGESSMIGEGPSYKVPHFLLGLVYCDGLVKPLDGDCSLFSEGKFRRVHAGSRGTVAVHAILVNFLRHNFCRQIHSRPDNGILLPSVISHHAAEP